MAGRLQGKVALVTGAGRGQGRAHCLRMAAEGADILAVDICADVPDVPYPMANRADLAETVRLVEALDRRVIEATGDVRDVDALAVLCERGVSEFGRLDIVSANAGVGTRAYANDDLPQRVWQQMLDINLTGVWNTVRAAVPHLIRGGRGGSIVLTSSAAGIKPYPYMAHYVTAKHAVVGMMRSLALELAPHSIRVNSVHPTQVDTPMVMNEAIYRLFRPDLDNPGRADIAEVSQAMNALAIPWVDPVDISNAVLFLSSDEARYVTGIALPVDAGCLL